MKSLRSKINSAKDAFGLDLEVNTIQKSLANTGFIEQIFSIASVQKRTKSEEESKTSFNEGLRGTSRYDMFYPQGKLFSDSGDYYSDIDLTFDDTYASRVFFLNTESATTNPAISRWDWTNSAIEIKHPVSVIFHCNLQSLQSTSSEYIKSQFLTAIGRCPKVIGHKLYESMENVWKEFTITPEMNGLTRYPNYCLRLDTTITYLALDYNQP